MNNIKLIVFVVGTLWLVTASAQDATKPIISEGEHRLQENQAAQATVDTLHEETQGIVEAYQSQLKVLDGLRTYNQILTKQIERQEQEVVALQETIANSAVIQRQILPLLTRMLDGLEDFIHLDVPFLLEERYSRISNLRTLIMRPDLSNAEKARRVFEAFQIEIDYGDTIESYKSKFNLDDKTFDVDFLRVGRIAFMYRTVGAEDYGYWDKSSRSWQPVVDSIYKRNIDKGIKMARQEMAPELLTIPVANVKGEEQ